MENNSIFQRHEVKYLVDSRQRAILEQAFRMHMVPDPHGESTISNVYQIERGYENLVEKLQSLGARIEQVELGE